MKNKIILNITTLSSILLFTACSNSQNNINPKTSNVSIYTIMGISEASQSYVEHQITTQKETYQEVTSQKNVSHDITYVSYKKRPTPTHYKLRLIQDIENRAKSFLGVPYVWGATGPSKFDCSGFTQWVYRDSGINIPRVSRDQARVGEFISYNDLQRGDMVFFDTKKKRTGIVSHVGIYLGNGDFIHASSAGKSVVIYNFNEKEFYKKRFLWGRRVLKPDFYYALN
jgi:cell wall-associated NlpC family hydrolase